MTVPARQAGPGLRSQKGIRHTERPGGVRQGPAGFGGVGEVWDQWPSSAPSYDAEKRALGKNTYGFARVDIIRDRSTVENQPGNWAKTVSENQERRMGEFRILRRTRKRSLALGMSNQSLIQCSSVGVVQLAVATCALVNQQNGTNSPMLTKLWICSVSIIPPEIRRKWTSFVWWHPSLGRSSEKHLN